ncbi:MAG: zeta toxin family protein [Candidatus Riflebacteria bacterium]|nr:zeta toxin family protein [Candidatus Riflebacteria bacterium]
MTETAPVPCIYVLAGTNGAGKSSIGGATFRSNGADYFNPDEAARRILEASPGLPMAEANSAAWLQGKRLLERAIVERLDFAFETTLGGTTITTLLEDAVRAGLEVRIWYMGLDGVERHIERVRARVAAGGHDIPESKIRERYVKSRLNLIRLLPLVTEVRVFDNSGDNDPREGKRPVPQLVLHMKRGKVVATCPLATAPTWTKPILAVAVKLSR